MRTQVLIVGAGPTGLALAVQLIRHGIDFMIIDQNEGTTSHSKAIGVHARTLEIYQQIELADDLISKGAIARASRLLEGGKIRGEIKFDEIGTGLSPYPFLLLVEQGRHESMLYDFLRQNARDVEWKTELIEFIQNEAGVTAKVRSNVERIETIEAKYLVGCDGAKSLVRNALGLKFGGGTIERFFYVADVEIDWQFSHDALHVCFAKNTLTAFFPMTGSERNYRIVGVFPEGHEKDESEILYEEIERQIVADTELELDITMVNWFSVYRVHSRHVNKFSVGRCFLAGDSAHIHTPAGAQGMNTGIQDGYNLAWKLALVLKDRSSGEILNSYNEERLPNAKRLIRTTDRFFQAGASRNPILSFVRMKILPYVAGFLIGRRFVANMIFPLVSQIGINYRESSLSSGGEGFAVKAGDRMPYFLVEGESIYQYLKEPHFHLLMFLDGSSPAPEVGDALSVLADHRSFPLYPHVADIFGTTDSFTVLLRPDNHIGYIGSGTDLGPVSGYLEKILI